MIKINQTQAVIGLPKISKPTNNICKSCQLSKQTRTNFKTKEHSTSKPIDLIHTNLCGLSRTQTLQNERYFMFFINDFTRMVWVTFLKEKSEAFDKFRIFKPLAENESENKIKCLCSYNGGEFTSNSTTFVKNMGLRDNFLLQELPNKIG